MSTCTPKKVKKKYKILLEGADIHLFHHPLLLAEITKKTAEKSFSRQS